MKRSCWEKRQFRAFPVRYRKMHLFISVGWTILLLYFKEGLCETFKMEYFYKDTERHICNDSSETFEERSELMCAVRCKQRSTCKSFRFWDERKTCYLSDTMLCNTEDAYYEWGVTPTKGSTETNCTLFPTYRLNTDFNICYRVVKDSVTRAEAIEACRHDHPSAHMITLRNTSMMAFFNAEVAADYWIDGEYSFVTWDNKPMPWENWCDSVRPTMTSIDAVFIHKSNSCMNKHGVGGSQNYVCEID